MKKRLDIVVNNHMDLIWRRCFSRRFSDEGKIFVSYQDIEQYYIEENLSLCETSSEYKFQIESVAVLQAYLARKPQDATRLKELHQAGRLRVAGTGVNIVDGNLPGGESLVRNFVLGQLYLREFFGAEAKLANRDDAFGNCAQMPQILKGCGMDWVKGLSYSTCRKDYWRGLDGSTVCTKMLPISGMGGGWRKYSPCPECGGTGIASSGEACVYCKGRGIDRPKQEKERQTICLTEPCPEHSVVMVGGEEILPDNSVLYWKKQLDFSEFNADFALEEEQYTIFKDDIYCTSPDVHNIHFGELNPNNTGCYVTRIKTKQLARQTENRLLQLESLLVRAVLQGREWPKQTLREMWGDHLFTLFHDAVTATHVDPAYQELLDTWENLHKRMEALLKQTWEAISLKESRCYSVVNHTGFCYTGLCHIPLRQGGNRIEMFDSSAGKCPVVAYQECEDGRCEAVVLLPNIPPYGSLVLTGGSGQWQAPQTITVEQKHPAGIEAGILRADDSVRGADDGGVKHVLENEYFELHLARNGVAKIYDKRMGCVVAGGANEQALVFYLEQDVGSPWATVLPGTQRMDLTAYTYLHKIEEHQTYRRAYYMVDLPQTIYGTINGIRLEFWVTLYTGMPRVDIEARVQWDAYNVRLRMGVRTAAKGKKLYEIPYGVLEREPYSPTYGWTGAGGDWPAQCFFGISGDWSLAVLNQGTPSCCIEEKENGVELSTSLLRSPTMPTYLHEPDAYSMRAFDGMRDTGCHHFQLAIVSYEEPLENTAVVADAHCFNSEPYAGAGRIPNSILPILKCSHAYISSIKQAENGNALVCRIVEYRGMGGKAKLCLSPDIRHVEKTNMLEDTGQNLFLNTSGEIEWTIEPFEIATIKIFH